MTAIAEAFATIRPDFSKFGGEVQRGISKEVDAASKKAGDSGGRNLATSLASSATSNLRGLGDRITSGLGTAFKAGAVGVAAGVATTIGLGLKRLVGIEEAQAKMRGLGYDTATVEKVMVNALASVKGTAFGLADAASVAAGVLAAGVEPGQDLERTLKLVGDTATIAGASFGEMGSIFNKVGAANRLTMQEVNQLSDRGIPIMQYLGEQYGVTALEARKMVERGEVDFAAFRTAIEKNIGGAAAESGKTTMGAFRNMGAAAGRLGAVIAGPVFSSAQKFFTNVIDWIDTITPQAEQMATELGDRLGVAMRDLGNWAKANLLPVLERLVGVVRNGIKWYRENTEAIHRVVRAAGPAAIGVAALATSISLVTKAWLLLRAATPLGLLFAVGTAIVYLYQNSETFRRIVTAAFEAVQRTVAVAMPAVSAAIDAVAPVVQNLAVVVRSAWGFMSTTIQNSVRMIQGVVATFLAVLRGDWGKAWDGIKQSLSAVWDQMRNVVTLASALVRLAIETALAAIGALWRAAWERIRTDLAQSWETIKRNTSDALAAVVQFFREMPGKVVAAVQLQAQALLDLGRWIVRKVLEGIIALAEASNGISGWMTGLPRRIADWVMEGAGRLVQLGKDIVGKIVDGIKSVAGDIGSALVGGVSSGGGNLLNSVAGAGKSLYDRYVGDGPGRPPAGGGSAMRRVQSALTPGTYITSSYRTPAHNARVGGSPTSYHMDRGNPAVDIGGSTAALDRLAAKLRAMGGWREFLWRTKGHWDHIHVAHDGGQVASSWPTIPGLRSDERPAILQVGETVVPRDGVGGLVIENAYFNNPDPTADLDWYVRTRGAGV